MKEKEQKAEAEEEAKKKHEQDHSPPGSQSKMITQSQLGCEDSDDYYVQTWSPTKTKKQPPPQKEKQKQAFAKSVAAGDMVPSSSSAKEAGPMPVTCNTELNALQKKIYVILLRLFEDPFHQNQEIQSAFGTDMVKFLLSQRVTDDHDSY